MAGSRTGPAFCMNEASTWKSYSYLHLQRTDIYTIDPKLIDKITKFISTPQTWPISSVSPLDFHIKEEKNVKASVYSQE